MPYRVNLPPFDASGRVYTRSPYHAKAETVETLETKPAPPLSPGAKDPYQVAADAALETLCRMNLPAGLIVPWMERERPELHRKQAALFDLAARLWQEHAPLDQFESVLNEWLSCFRLAESFFRERDSKQQLRDSEREPGEDLEEET